MTARMAKRRKQKQAGPRRLPSPPQSAAPKWGGRVTPREGEELRRSGTGRVTAVRLESLLCCDTEGRPKADRGAAKEKGGGEGLKRLLSFSGQTGITFSDRAEGAAGEGHMVCRIGGEDRARPALPNRKREWLAVSFPFRWFNWFNWFCWCYSSSRTVWQRPHTIVRLPLRQRI